MNLSGSKLEIVTSHYGLIQIINELTHILEDSSTFVFTSQSVMVLDSGVHFSLHPNSHHQIEFAKFDLKVYYPPPCMQILLRSKKHLPLSTGNKHFLTTLSIRRFLFLMKQSSML